MVKATEPTASVLVPSDFGWVVYVDSLVKGDREKHGGVWSKFDWQPQFDRI
jgi:hypothetical protein